MVNPSLTTSVRRLLLNYINPWYFIFLFVNVYLSFKLSSLLLFLPEIFLKSVRFSQSILCGSAFQRHILQQTSIGVSTITTTAKRKIFKNINMQIGLGEGGALTSNELNRSCKTNKSREIYYQRQYKTQIWPTLFLELLQQD